MNFTNLNFLPREIISDKKQCFAGKVALIFDGFGNSILQIINCLVQLLFKLFAFTKKKSVFSCFNLL